MPPSPSPAPGRAVRLAIRLAAALLTAACATSPDDSILVLAYGERALGQHVLRRIRLVTAGVELRGPLAADTVWAHALGHTIILRRPVGVEGDVRAVRPQRDGVPLRTSGRGFRRRGTRGYELERGYWIADVFDPRDEYLASAVVADTLSVRRLFQHLGLARPLSERLDRLYLPAEEVAGWRELLPVVIQNRGIGYLYTRPRRDADLDADRQADRPAAAPDSVELLAQRFDLEEVDGWILVGRTRRDQHYRHVFAPGGEYRFTALQYGGRRLAGRDLLEQLDLPGGPVGRAGR